MPWTWTTDASGWQSRTWGNPTNQVRKPGWWHCNHPDCVKALKDCGRKPQANHPSKSACDFCGLAWNSQTVEKQAQLVKAKEGLRAKLAEAGPAVLSKTQSRRMRNKATAAKAKADQQNHGAPAAKDVKSADAKPSEAKTKDHAPDPAKPTRELTATADGRWPAMTFSKEILETITQLLPALSPVTSSMGEDKIPQGNGKVKTAAEVVERLLAGRKPVELAAQKVELDAKITKLQALATSAEGVPEAKAALEVQLKEAQAESAALAKTKKGHTEQAQICALQQVLADFRTEVQDRKDRRFSGQMKASERKEFRQQYLQTLREQIDLIEEELDTLEEEADSAHASLEDEHTQRDSEVVTQLQSLISDLQPLMLVNGTPAVTPVAAVIGADATPPPQPELEAAVAAQKELEKKIAKLQKAAEEQGKKEKERKRLAADLRAMRTAFERTIDGLSLEDLPVLEVPKGEALAKQVQMHSLLSQWHAAGMKTSFTFQDLIDHASLGAETPIFLKTVLGDKWDVCFTTEPKTTDVMPQQAATLVYQNLDRLGQHWAKASSEEATKAAAASSYAALAGAAKKRRADITDALMV